MYLFTPKKKYDPTPYSYFKRWLHNIIGCPMQQIEITRETNKKIHFLCKCGKAIVWQ